MDIERKQYIPPSADERAAAYVEMYNDKEISEEERVGGTESQLAEARDILKTVRNSNEWFGHDYDFIERLAALTTIAETDWAAYEKGIDELGSMFIGVRDTLKGPSLMREKNMEVAVGHLRNREWRAEGIKAIRSLDPALQEQAATRYFNETIGDGVMPITGSLDEQYDVYLSLKGTGFGRKFAELENERRKKNNLDAFKL